MSLASSDTCAKAATRSPLGALVAPINAIFLSRDAARRKSAERAPSTTSSLPEPRSRRTLSTSNATMISMEDFESLSPSIKKKYFSSAERLHIVQRTASSRRRKRTRVDPYRASSSYQNTDFDIRPATSTGVSLWRRPSQCPEYGDPSALTRLDPDAISEEQARWYLSLPDKIRRQQFTRKEQISLAVRCKRALHDSAPDFADDALRRCLNGRRQDSLDRPMSQRRRQSLATVDTEILINDGDTLNESQGRRPSDTFATQIEIFNLYANPDPHDASEPISIPPPPLPAMASTGKPRRQTSFSRAATFTPISLPPPQLAPVPAVPPLPPALQPQSFVSPTSWVEVDGNETVLTAQGPINESRPYHQPDVRKQLRHHLSPEKFDEALEFGFSVPDDREHGTLSAAAEEQSSPSQPPALCYTSDEGEEDASDSLENSGPRTPTTVADNVYSTVMRPSFDSNGRSSLRQPSLTAIKPPKSRSPWSSVGNREMTIHMTLTRRDLLDVERVDPLALEPLPICDDPTGAHGAFAVGSGKNPRGLRRMWNSLRGH